jgi:bacterioferritin-associated ferredoxin
MIVCHCNCITDSAIAETTCGLVASDYAKLPTPGYVYHQLGKRMRCATCLPHAAEIIAETIDRCAICPRAQMCIGRMAVANDDAIVSEELGHERQAGGSRGSE